MGSILTTVVRTGLNYIVPGMNAVFGFANAGLNFMNGDFSDCFMNTICGICDLASFGIFSTLKSRANMAKEVWNRGLKGMTPTILFDLLKNYMDSKLEYIHNISLLGLRKTLILDGIRGLIESGGTNFVESAVNKMISSTVSRFITGKEVTNFKFEKPDFEQIKDHAKNPANIKTFVIGTNNFIKHETNESEEGHGLKGR